MTKITTIPTKHVIKIINHAKTIDNTFSLYGPSINAETGELILPGRLGIQTKTRIIGRLNEFDEIENGDLDNTKNEKVANFVKYLKRQNVPYVVNLDGIHIVVTATIPITNKIVI